MGKKLERFAFTNKPMVQYCKVGNKGYKIVFEDKGIFMARRPHSPCNKRGCGQGSLPNAGNL